MNKKIIITTLATSLLFIGCGEDLDNEGNHLPTTKITQQDKNVDIGTKIKLDSTAFDVDGDALKFKWSFSSKPKGSKAFLSTSSKKNSSFNIDKEGKYIIKFVATDVVGAKASDTVNFTAKKVGNVSNNCKNYIELSRSITSDTTLNGCYKVTSNISVSNNALLTIKAGTILSFEDSTGINISSTGALKAVGSVAKPILFTGVQKTAGYWNGIRYQYSNNVKNELSYATIEYAGGNGYANLLLDSSEGSPSRVKLNTLTLKHSLTHGFWFDNDSIISSFKKITSTKNKLTAGLLYANALKALDTASKFKGNLGDDYITVKGSTLSKNSTWKALSVPLYIAGSLHIDSTLNIEEGSKLIFESQTGLSVSSKGSLKAVGTKSKPILFTGVQKTAGYWNGIRYQYSNNVKNELSYVTIEYAGGNGYANLLLDSTENRPSRITVKHSVFSNSSRYGIWLDDYSITNNDIISANSFTNNSKGVIKNN